MTVSTKKPKLDYLTSHKWYMAYKNNRVRCVSVPNRFHAALDSRGKPLKTFFADAGYRLIGEAYGPFYLYGFCKRLERTNK